jgi:DNA-binding MarR family transcriptional regulator
MAIVKSLDDHRQPALPELLDHIGWQLWQAAQGWKARYEAAMIAEGYSWFGEARARIFGALDQGGLPQGVLADRLQITKQAVQQLIDQLEDDGFVRRVPDPSDGRGRVVHYTAKGAQLLRDANQIKKRLDRSYRRRLGESAYTALESALRVLNAG